MVIVMRVDNRDPSVVGSQLLDAHKLYPDMKLHEIHDAYEKESLTNPVRELPATASINGNVSTLAH